MWTTNSDLLISSLLREFILDIYNPDILWSYNPDLRCEHLSRGLLFGTVPVPTVQYAQTLLLLFNDLLFISQSQHNIDRRKKAWIKKGWIIRNF
jgi:hypothetical protein